MSNTKSLPQAIEDLYQAFSKYSLGSNMVGCPCCVSHTDKSSLHSKPLRLLQEEDISRYVFKAMTTWGDSEDFRHFLPRIFELLSTNMFIVDTEVVLGKLHYAGWLHWPVSEIQAIRTFALSWFVDTAMHGSYPITREAFIEIYGLLPDIQPLLNAWQISLSDSSFNSFIAFIHKDFYSLTTNKKKQKALAEPDKQLFIQWVAAKKTIMEEGFFKFEKTDPDFAQRISDTLYMLERIAQYH